VEQLEAGPAVTPLRITQGAGGGNFGPASIGHLLDGTCRVLRPVETSDGSRRTLRRYTVVYASLPFTINRKNATLGLRNGGVVEVGSRVAYLDMGPQLQKRDIIDMLTGPHAPGYIEVESVSAPRGHHLEIRVLDYEGNVAIT
jgi:hypothetical protein